MREETKVWPVEEINNQKGISGCELTTAVREETKVWPVEEINNYGVHLSL